MTTIQLTPAQHAILAYAIHNTSGKVDWFPDHIKGGARQKVLHGLFIKALITRDGHGNLCVAAEGYDAMGLPRPGALPPTITLDDPALEADVASAEAGWQTQAKQKPVRTRADSKQATVISMLKRTEGATIRQICEATGWESPTTRGFFAGTVKKKLGLDLTSEKPEIGERVYHLAA